MLKIACVKHPRYNGKKSPRASCEGCLVVWYTRSGISRRELSYAGVRVVERQEKVLAVK